MGIYQSKSRAAYWDGKNVRGEPVASGVYFYTLTAGDFTATRKMNLIVVSDTFLPLRFILTAGARHDVTQVSPALIAGYTCDTVIADAAYDSDAFRAEIVDQGSVPVIRPRKNRLEDRPYDENLYKLRNVIERFFHRLKQYRRVATRYDKYACRYLGFVYFAAILITAKKM